MSILLPDYGRLDVPGVRGIALETCRGALESILAGGTIYDFALRQPDARQFAGRAPVYAFSLPDGCGDAVVRRSMRGGALARLETDLFLPPTRSLRELITSLRLRAAGVPTPEMIGFAVYPAGGLLRRSDVVTREIRGASDLASLMGATGSSEQRGVALEAAAALVAALSVVGAHHPDLNLRNILVTFGDGAGGERAEDPEMPRAHVLDVDRIRFHIPGDPMVLRANIDRLERSILKWRDHLGLTVSAAELATLRERATELAG